MKQCNEELLNWYSHQQQLEEKLLEEERMTLLENLLHFLPPLRRKAMELYYWQNFSLKRIARLLCLSASRVIYEIHQALDFLQKVAGALSRPIKQKKTQPGYPPKTAALTDGLPDTIFRLRHEHKMSFTHIASTMNHSPVFVHQCYIETHARLHRTRQTA